MKGFSSFAIIAIKRAAAMMVAATAACAPVGEEAPSLALACQLKPCECAPAAGKVFGVAEDQPVLWARDGGAFCPEGHILRRGGGGRSDFVKRYGG